MNGGWRPGLAPAEEAALRLSICHSPALDLSLRAPLEAALSRAASGTAPGTLSRERAAAGGTRNPDVFSLQDLRRSAADLAATAPAKGVHVASQGRTGKWLGWEDGWSHVRSGEMAHSPGLPERNCGDPGRRGVDGAGCRGMHLALWRNGRRRRPGPSALRSRAPRGARHSWLP